MQVNLRKAAAIQSEISSALREIEVSPYEVFEDKERVVEEMAEKTQEWKTNLLRKQTLNAVLYSMRDKVGQANVASGVSKLLTEERRINADMHWLEAILDKCKGEKYYSADEIVSKLEQLEKKSEDRENYFSRRGSTVSSILVTKEELAEFRKEMSVLKKQLRKINDSLLELNISTEISLSDKEVTVLETEDLL